MNLKFEEYEVRKLVNVRKHVDGGWFWDKYSAAPYIGCRFGCEFCYLRGDNYGRYQNPMRYDSHIRVKVNAPLRLEHELRKLSRDIITCGDWQLPAERKYRLSREMLKILLKLRFPLVIIERSPALLDDLDLLLDIHQQTAVTVLISISSLSQKVKHAFEQRSPGLKQRFKMMSVLSSVGIPTGTSMMPLFPGFGDHTSAVQDIVQATADHGGSFVVGAGLTMSGIQAERTFAAAGAYFPEYLNVWRNQYYNPSDKTVKYSPDPEYRLELARRIRNCCIKTGINDRMPRPIFDPRLARNKKISELLFLKLYDQELNGADDQILWKIRKSAWALDELK